MAPITITRANLTDSTHDYYIHPNENPSLVLVSPVLDGSNYHGWARAMAMSLQMKNKFGFADGSIAKLADEDPMLSAWKRCNNLVLSWINHSVTPEIATSIIWIDTASAAWQDLKDRFSQGDSVRISHLHHDLYSLTQADLSITAYYTKMKILWDELCNYRPIPVCASPNACCCEAVKIFKQYRENDCVLCFLRGLNDNYAAARSQILLMEPLPTLSKIFSMIIQQERHLGIGVLPEPAALAVQTTHAQGSHSQQSTYHKGKPSYQHNSGKANVQRQCTHCGRLNHTVETCFLKHGYPPGFPNGYNPKKAYAAVAGNDSHSSPDQDDPPSSSLELTTEQFQSLLALLPASKPTAVSHPISKAAAVSTNLVSSHNVISNNIGNTSFQWILDSGATDHIVSSLSFFSSYYAIKPVPISLPNGAHAIANHLGTVYLSPTLTLHNVLYIPEFSVNLVSIHKLTKVLNYRLTFTDSLCLIKDKTTLKMIGKAEIKDGLYIMVLPPLLSVKPLHTFHAVNMLHTVTTQNPKP